MSYREKPRRYSSPELTSGEPQEQSRTINKARKGEAVSQAPLSPTGRRRHPKLRIKRHTMDTTRGTVDDDSRQRRGSSGLLQRVFSRRQRSKNGSGSTAESNISTDDGDIDALATDGTPSRRTRRATMDTVDTNHAVGAGSSSAGEEVGRIQGTSARTPPAKSSSMVGGYRRATMDMGSSSHSKRRTRPATMSQTDYIHTQHRLQHQADDYAKCGDLEKAIEVYVQAFHLAEDQQDSLASKTELMCTILGLHMQAAWAPDPTISEDDAQRQLRYHKQNARRYLNRIKPAILQPSWFIATTELIEFFVENEAWEIGLVVAEHVIKVEGINAALNIISVDKLARLHFEVAQKKAKSNRRGEALQHLQSSCKYLQEAGTNKDTEIYIEVLHQLAAEYSSQGQYPLALEALQEQLHYTQRKKRPFLHCQIAADIYVPLNKLDLALEQLQEASAILDLEADSEFLDDDDDEQSQVAVELFLLQTKADVLFRLGKMEQSLHVYEGALGAMNHPDANVNPADKAKILYTMGRLCARLKRYRRAIDYFTQELEITQVTLGYHLSVSRVLHELARLYDEGLGDYRMALLKYKEAFRVEYTVLQQCQLAIPNCEDCLAKRRTPKRPNSSVPSRPCPVHFNLQRDVAQQIRETKKCQGRLHFKLGDFQKALQTSMPQNAMGGGAAAARKQPQPQESSQ